jgi:prepilin signal peptidase PulO-like enzyme (type II secretory pathway)
MGWANDFTAGQIKLIGLAEIAGAIGLLAPWATQIVPVLTPIAAACLAFIMLGAVRIHATRKEPWAPPLVLAVLCAFVAVGRLI